MKDLYETKPPNQEFPPSKLTKQLLVTLGMLELESALVPRNHAKHVGTCWVRTSITKGLSLLSLDQSPPVPSPPSVGGRQGRNEEDLLTQASEGCVTLR